MAEEESKKFGLEKDSVDRAESGDKDTNNDKDGTENYKSAEDVISSALDYYREKRDQIIKEEDQGYDRSKIEYDLAYMPSKNYHKWEFEEIIDSGKSIDSAKDIDPLSERDAKNYLSQVEILKNSSLYDVISLISLEDLKSLKDQDAYDMVQDKALSFFEKYKKEGSDKEIDFDGMIKSAMTSIAKYWNPGRPMNEAVIKMLGTPENSFAVSAISEILKAAGSKNEFVSKGAARFENNLSKLIEKIEGKSTEEEFKEIVENKKKEEKEGSVDAVSEKKEEGKNVEKEEPKNINEESDLQEKEETKKEEEKSIESVQEVPQEEKTSEESSEVNKEEEKLTEPVVQPIKDDTIKGKEKPSTKKTPKGEEKKSSLKSYIEDLFSPILSGSDSSDTGSLDSGGGTDVKKTSAKDVSDMFLSAISGKKPENKEGKKTTLSGSPEKIKEKKSETPETSSSSLPIKETKIQNLASKSPKPEISSTDKDSESKVNKTLETEKNEANSTLTEETSSTENKESGDKKSSGSIDTKGEENTSAEALEKKMDAMIAILSEVSETLQGPLVVKSSNRVYD
jgi:hypothetical protein